MAKKPPQHGGKREGSGRPKLPAGEKRDKLFAIRVTSEEKKLLDESEALSWAREVLVKAARRRDK
jgi:hypothetical protein